VSLTNVSLASPARTVRLRTANGKDVK
jgi:hypothetical protein